jgi:hypothetical protein
MIQPRNTTAARAFNAAVVMIFVLAALLFFLPWIAHAQEAAAPAAGSELAGKEWDVFAGLWVSLGGGALSLLGWLFSKLVGWLTAKTKNEYAQYGLGFLQRLGAVVWPVVLRVNEVEKAAILKARAPDSPGGEAITKDEGEALYLVARNEVVAAFGGWEKMIDQARFVVFGDGAALEGLIRNHVEAAITKTKAPDPSVPRAA